MLIDDLALIETAAYWSWCNFSQTITSRQPACHAPTSFSIART